MVSDHYTVYALDLPGMDYSEIVPGASYREPQMRTGVERLLTELDLHDVTLVGESLVRQRHFVISRRGLLGGRSG
ncbi:MAG TPA: hypothetical protein VLL08_02910 [Kineosporiaceae bacterium]|nr:hypothetical protein [Kineosporiaceae bacterium]